MATTSSSLFRRLADKQILLPYLENAFHNDNWPDKYSVEVDSSEYYGLEDEYGVTHDVGVGDGYFHPSSHPMMTARELYYRFHPEYSHLVRPERRTLSNHFALAAGSAMHAVVQTQLEMANVLVKGKPEQLDVWEELRPGVKGCHPERNPYEWEYINHEHMVRGRLDGLLDLPSHGVIGFEFKTKNSQGFRGQMKPMDEWYAQTQLGMDNSGVTTVVLLMLEMGWPFEPREFVIRRDPQFIEGLYEKFDYVRECIQRGTPPMCEHALGSRLAKECPTSHLCWGTDD